MHTGPQLLGKHCIDHAMALDSTLSAERLSHNMNPEMCLPARPRSRMTLVLCGFVHHLYFERRESLGQLFPDDIPYTH